MSDGEALDTLTAGHEPHEEWPKQLDPFAFFQDESSKIRGLGGELPRTIEGYVCHTAYQHLGEDSFVYIVKIDGLIAERGSIDFSVHAISAALGGSAHAIELRNRTLQSWSIEPDDEMLIPFDALNGGNYALFGYIAGATDALARSLTISLWRRADLDARVAQLMEAQQTQHGASDIRAAARLVGEGVPTLSAPISQVCTAAQLAEPAHDRRLAQLGHGGSRDPALWSQTFIMQALDRYGLSAPNASGIALWTGANPLPAALASLGCRITVLDEMDVTRDAFRSPGICEDATFERQVSLISTTSLDIPETVSGFDFCWSIGLDARVDSQATLQALVEHSLRCLKPKGLAVHVFHFASPAASGTLPLSQASPLKRSDVDRLALSMISRGHEVAQLNYASNVHPAGKRKTKQVFDQQTLFGLIVRRGLIG